LIHSAKACALLSGRGYVTPDDVKEVFFDVLRHRLILSYEAEAEEVSVEDILEKILEKTDSP
jgi:MoxR-like ATPase